MLTAQWGGDLAVMKMLVGRWKFQAAPLRIGVSSIVFKG